MAGLTEKQKRFVAEYLVDLNATQAARRAGYKDPNIGRQLITKNNVSAAIQKAVEERERRTEITQDAVVQELAAIAFARATDYAEINGPRIEIKSTNGMTDKQIAAIASMKQGMRGIELKLYDKVCALELLGKQLGMFQEKRESDQEDEVFGVVQLAPQAEEPAPPPELVEQMMGEVREHE